MNLTCFQDSVPFALNESAIGPCEYIPIPEVDSVHRKGALKKLFDFSKDQMQILREENRLGDNIYQVALYHYTVYRGTVLVFQLF